MTMRKKIWRKVSMLSELAPGHDVSFWIITQRFCGSSHHFLEGMWRRSNRSTSPPLLEQRGGEEHVAKGGGVSPNFSQHILKNISWFGAFTSHLIPCGLRIHTPRQYLRMHLTLGPSKSKDTWHRHSQNLRLYMSTSCEGIQEFFVAPQSS